MMMMMIMIIMVMVMVMVRVTMTVTMMTTISMLSGACWRLCGPECAEKQGNCPGTWSPC